MYTETTVGNTFDIYGRRISIQFDRKSYPSGEKMWLAEQSLSPPETKDTEKILAWFIAQFVKARIYMLLGCEIDFVSANDAVIYWTIEEIPWR